MDKTEPSIAVTKPSPLTHTEHMGRALVSAGVFGMIGGTLGHWLGLRGNDPSRRFAAPIMKWGLGIFSAVLGLYSSFKASERIEQASPQSTAAIPVTAITDVVTQAAITSNVSAAPVPLSAIHTGATEHKGVVQDAIQHQIA